LMPMSLFHLRTLLDLKGRYEKIIALSGIKRSGKDSVAAILVDRGYTHFKFSDHLAKLVTEVVGQQIAAIYAQDHMKEVLMVGIGKSWRELMIEIGARERAKDPAVFIKKVIEAINRCENDLIVISDVRMVNELEGLREAFPVSSIALIWIDRHGCIPNQSIPTESGECRPLAHYVIQNNNEMRDLKRAALHTLDVIELTREAA